MPGARWLRSRGASAAFTPWASTPTAISTSPKSTAAGCRSSSLVRARIRLTWSQNQSSRSGRTPPTERGLERLEGREGRKTPHAFSVLLLLRADRDADRQPLDVLHWLFSPFPPR